MGDCSAGAGVGSSIVESNPSKPVWTLDQIVANLDRWFTGWAPGTPVSYSFYTVLPSQHSEVSYYQGFQSFTGPQQAAVRMVMQLISEVANISFVEAADNGESTNRITFAGSSTMPDFAWGWASLGWSGSPGQRAQIGGAEVWINSDYTTGTFSPGTYDFVATIHEIIHALGVPHPGEYNAGTGGIITYDESAEYVQDTRQYTVMSYFDASLTGAVHNGYYGQTPLLHDVAVLQRIYGANHTTRSGDTVYGFNATAGDLFDFSLNTNPILAIWDGGGTDQVDLSGYSQGCRLDLREGAFSDVGGLTANLAVCYGAVIENAVGGSGADSLVGNAAVNNLAGGDGDDTLEGLGGGDALTGGGGVDTLSYQGSTLGVYVRLFNSTAFGGDANGDVISGFENVTGSALNDDLRGSAGDNVLNGGSGDDLLIGMGGADTLNGGDGSDTISYLGSTLAVYVRLFNGAVFGGDANGDLISGVENVVGSSAGDDLIGSAVGNVLDGGGGNDSLQGLAGDDVLVGGAGDDTLAGGDGFDTVSYAGSAQSVQIHLLNNTAFGGDANGDVISGFENVIGSAFNDDLIGSAGANVLSGGAGVDSLQGLGGDDTLVGGAGGDTLAGGDGLDTVSYAGSALAVYVRLFNSTAFGGDANGDVISGFENATGSSLNDDLMGSTGANILSGGAGNDLIQGLAGDDTLIGGAGADTLNGGDGIDTLSYLGSALAVYVRLFNSTVFGGDANGDVISGVENVIGSGFDDDLMGSAGANRLDGGAGDDLLQGLAGADALVGGEGLDTASYAGSGQAVTVRLYNNTASGGDAAGDSFSGVENLLGSGFNDDLTGTGGANRLDGAAGDDLLQGQAGADSLIGGAGDDLLVGGQGGDSLTGGDGIDTVSYAGSALAVYVRLFNNSALGGDANGDVLSGVENAIGSSNNDDLMGSSGANVLTGGAGNDLIQGLGGNDTLIGGTGGDTFNGGDGIDTISYLGSALGVYVRLFNGTAFGGDANGDVISNVENATGSAGNDDLMGSAGANVLDGGGGSDLIQGLGGDDVLIGGAGGDTLNGGDGLDTVDYTASDAAVTIRLWNQTGAGGHGAGDTYVGVENAVGSTFRDFVIGSTGANRLEGGAGDDHIDAQAGDDILVGGLGADTLIGGTGADLFVFSGASGSDTVSDFAAGVGAGDVIQLSAALFASFAEVLASTTDDGLGNTVISKGGVTIKLTGVLEGQLAADDFLFTGPAAPVATASTPAAVGLRTIHGADLWGRPPPQAESELVELAGVHAPDHPVAISPLDIMGRLAEWRPAAAWDYDWVA